jgi:hypothetical protein
MNHILARATLACLATGNTGIVTSFPISVNFDRHLAADILQRRLRANTIDH